jgi:hypothetical protein
VPNEILAPVILAKAVPMPGKIINADFNNSSAEFKIA